MVRKLALTAAVAAMSVLPIMAHAAPVAPRTPAEVSGKDEKIVGLVWQYVLLPIVIAAVLGLVLGGDDDDVPESP